MKIRRSLLCVIVCGVFVVASVAFAGDSAQPARAANASDKAQPARPAPEKALSLELAEVAVCRGVENHTPVQDQTSFPADVGKLFCFTDVRNAQEPTQIYHRWYIGEKMVNEIPMTVRGPRWRCWSEKTILSSWVGECHVEIVTEEGDVIGKKSFGLQGADAPSAEPNPQGESAG